MRNHSDFFICFKNIRLGTADNYKSKSQVVSKGSREIAFFVKKWVKKPVLSMKILFPKGFLTRFLHIYKQIRYGQQDALLIFWIWRFYKKLKFWPPKRSPIGSDTQDIGSRLSDFSFELLVQYSNSSICFFKNPWPLGRKSGDYYR